MINSSPICNIHLVNVFCLLGLQNISHIQLLLITLTITTYMQGIFVLPELQKQPLTYYPCLLCIHHTAASVIIKKITQATSLTWLESPVTSLCIKKKKIKKSRLLKQLYIQINHGARTQTWLHIRIKWGILQITEACVSPPKVII